MKNLPLRQLALIALLGCGSLSVAKADVLGFDFVNPSSDGIIAEITGSLDNVTGDLSVTFIARSGMFFDGTEQFDFNVGDPSRGTVNEQLSQNSVFFDPQATVSHVPTVTVTGGSADVDGSVIGWQSGDTLITCGPIFEDNCGSQNFGFESAVWAQGAQTPAGTIDTNAILGGGSQTSSAPEPAYGMPLAALFAAFMLARKYPRVIANHRN